MDGSDEPTIYPAEREETLSIYLQRYSDDEFIRLIKHPVKSVEFFKILKARPVEDIKESVDQKLWKILKNTENHKNFLHHVYIWEPTRKKLLLELAKCSKDLNTISKICSFGRMFVNAVDSYYTIRGLSDSKANASHVATWCGALGIFLTLGGGKMSFDSFRQLTKLMQREQNLFAPIKSWYKENKELENAMKSVFPLDFTELLMEDITDIVQKRESYNPVNLLSRLTQSLHEKYKGKTKYAENIKTTISFLSHPLFNDYCEWIFIQEENQILLSGLNVLLQFYKSDLTYLVCRGVRAQTPSDQDLTSFPVLGRLGLNGLSILSDAWRLVRFEVPGVVEMLTLEKHWKRELELINRIAKYLKDINKGKYDGIGEGERTAENGGSSASNCPSADENSIE